MIGRRMLPFLLACAASLGVHFAAAMVMVPPAAPVLVEGGATPEIAALGSSFEDLLQGSDRLLPTDAGTIEPVATDAARSVEDALVPEPVRPESVQATRPIPVALARAEMVPAAAKPATVTPVAAVPAPSLAAAVTPAPSAPALPAAVSPKAELTETAVSTAAAEPASEPKEVEVAALTPAETVETLTARLERVAVPVPTPRPTPARMAKKPREKKAEPRREARTAPGNATRNARAGSEAGEASAKAKTGGGVRGGAASRAGNAAASNYPGKVYAKIRRTRQGAAKGSGVARVRFSISASGGLAAVSIAASSGSSSVDMAALDHVRRSAPFPRPPSGARRQFVIPIEVRR